MITSSDLFSEQKGGFIVVDECLGRTGQEDTVTLIPQVLRCRKGARSRGPATRGRGPQEQRGPEGHNTRCPSTETTAPAKEDWI